MAITRSGSRLALQVLRPPSFTTRRFASKIEIPFAPPPFPVVKHCPAPTCQCRESPPGLDIEREQDIKGSMPAYSEHVLISTGRSDWTSRIEEDERGSGLVQQLKGFLTRGGMYADPYHNVMVTNCSFPPTPESDRDGSTSELPNKPNATFSSAPSASAFLLPTFQYIPSIPVTTESVGNFIKGFILPHKISNAHYRLSREEQNILKREPELQRRFPGARKVDEILVLICGHGHRDERCGVLGPVLRDEFEEKLTRQNIPLLRDAPVAEADIQDPAVDGYVPTARVGLISHIGGHKWAGNVIVYIPPSFKGNALAGKGIWYGRVGPEHVEGIVAKTVLEGKVIKELFRGGVGQEGELLRL